jgi:hypothetical protein
VPGVDLTAVDDDALVRAVLASMRRMTSALGLAERKLT